MAIAITELVSLFDIADATTYAVASTSPAANSLLVLLYSTRHGTLAPGGTPSAVFGGTWVEPIAEQVDGISAIGCWLQQLGAAPGSAGFNLAMDGAVTAIGCGYALLQITGAETTGQPVQVIYGPTGTTSTTIAPTSAPALGNASNAQILYGAHRAADASTPEAGWTGGTDRTGASPNYGVRSSWKIGVYDSTPTMTIAAAARWQGLYLEIKIAGAVVPATPPTFRRNRQNVMIGKR
jgi:hypothetical protein